jgi:hypothetical protein
MPSPRDSVRQGLFIVKAYGNRRIRKGEVGPFPRPRGKEPEPRKMKDPVQSALTLDKCFPGLYYQETGEWL